MDHSTDTRIDRLARPQFGVVELHQARAYGVTEQNLRSRAADGSLRRLDAGVFATMGSAPSWEQSLFAACLAAGPDALASHRSAACLWGLAAKPVPIDVVVPYRQCPVPAGAILHSSTDLREIDRARRNGIPVTNPIRTVGDLGAVAPDLVPGAVEKGLYLKLFSVAGLWRLVDDLAKPGRRGLGVLRRVLEHRALGDRRSCSPLEPLFAAIAVGAGVNLEYQHPVTIDGRRYVLDFAMPEATIAIEIDGLDAHFSRRALDNDLNRQNQLVLAGWHPLRYSYTGLVKNRAKVRRELLQLIAQRRVTPGL